MLVHDIAGQLNLAERFAYGAGGCIICTAQCMNPTQFSSPRPEQTAVTEGAQSDTAFRYRF